MKTFGIPAFEDNYIWCIEHNGTAAVVDPGDEAPVLAHLAHNGLRLGAILVTHHHGDHSGGIAALVQRFDVPVFGPAGEDIAGVTVKLREGDTVNVPGIGAPFSVMVSVSGFASVTTTLGATSRLKTRPSTRRGGRSRW